MDAWTKEQHKHFKPQYVALINNFNKQYPERLKGMIELTDPHNVNIKAKVTQRILADIIEVNRTNFNRAIYGREGGGINISVEQAIKLSVVFGCTLDYLITGKERPVVTVQDNASIKTLQQALDTEQSMRKMLEDQNRELKAKLEACQQQLPMKVEEKSGKRKKAR